MASSTVISNRWGDTMIKYDRFSRFSAHTSRRHVAEASRESATTRRVIIALSQQRERE